MWPRVGVGVGVNNTKRTKRLKTTKPENEKSVENCGWSATQQQHSISRISAKHYENEEQVTENWRNCGWSVTQQQHRIRNKANGDTIYVKTCRIFAINTKMRNNSRRNRRNCGWSGTQQQHRKHETGTQRTGTKNTRTVLKSLFKWARH